MNQMHRRYGIGNEDMLYVLSTFVVTPLRWLDDFGWRRLHPHERRAAVAHYRALGRRMGIRDMPEDEAGFAALMDGVRGRTVRPHRRRAGGRRRDARAARHVSPVLGAAGRARPALDHLPHGPAPAARAAATRCRRGRSALAARAGMRLRAAVERRMAPRTTPITIDDLPEVRSYPDGFDLARLGTFARDGQTVVRRGRSIPSVKCSAAARSHISRRSSPSGTGKRSHVRARPAAGVSAGPQTSANS